MEPGQRKRWTAEDKLRVVLEGMRGDQAVADVCRKYGVNTTLYYTWKDKLLANAEKVFEHGNHRPSQKEQELVEELARARDALTEVTLENLELKKTRWGLARFRRPPK